MPAQTLTHRPSRSRTSTSRSAPLRRLRRLIKKVLREEPVAVTALIQAIVGIGIAFNWWQWTAAQTGAVVAMAAGLLTLIRGIVVPTAKQRAANVPAAAVAPAPATAGAVATSG